MENGHVFIPGKEETLLGRMRLRYSSNFDSYFVGMCEDFTNRPRKIGSSFTELANSYENIERKVDVNNQQVYIDRSNKSENGRLTWRFNFAPCGLVLDRVTMKISFNESNGGQVIVGVSGDSGSKSTLYCNSDMYMTITCLEGSSTLFITANLAGGNPDEISQIVCEPLEEDHHTIDYPLDLQIRLKRPDFTIGRSLIFIGLMYSKKELPTSGKGKLKKKSKSKKEVVEEPQPSAGYLNILIQKAKRLPCRENGAYAEPKVKCTLFGKGTYEKAKTRAIGKSLNPTWNERLTLPNVELEQLPYSQLELQVVHSKSMFKLKSNETLGYIVLQIQNVVGTWKKPVCRNHSVRRAEGLLEPGAFSSTKKNEKAHFASTETIVEEKVEKQIKSENENDHVESKLDASDDKQDISNVSVQSKLLLNRSRSLNNLSIDTTTIDKTLMNSTIPSSNLHNIEAYNLPFLKESSVDDVEEIVCSDTNNGNSEESVNENKKPNEEPFGDENSFLNDTIDSDVVNITFSDENVQNLLHRTPSGKTIKSLGDDSFEVLSSLDEDAEPNLCQIQNTLDESNTDLDSISTTLDDSQTLPHTQLNGIELGHCNDGIQQEDLLLRPDSSLNETDKLDESTIDTNNNTFESNGFLSVASNDNTVGSSSNIDLSGTIEEENIESKRRAVSVDNSQLTPSRTRRYDVNKTSETKHLQRNKPTMKRSHSMSDLLDVNRKREKKFNKRKGFSSKLYRSGSISNILDDFFEEKAKTLSHEHWSMVVSTPDKWFYCWHPLLGVNNLLSNWQ